MSRAEKFIDLKDTVWDGIGLDATGSIGDALEWLDEHPDQAPGRTITESAERDLYDSAQSSGAEFRAALSELGITVVPDPEPTNAEKIEELINKSEFRPIGYHGVAASTALARDLDRAGVKAPGGSR